MISLKEEKSVELWSGIGKATHFLCNFGSDFPNDLKKSLAHAANVRQDRRASKTRKSLLDSIRAAGILASSQRPLNDKEDKVGLIGEIIAEQVSLQRKFDSLWVKWKVGGTSKSLGIDLVVGAQRRGTSELLLVESKHIHAEVMGKGLEVTSPAIRARFADGLTEFDHEKTKLNLAGILRSMGKTIWNSSAASQSATAIEAAYDFVKSKLRQMEFSEEIITAIDSQYCTGGTLSECVHGLQLPASIGSHSLNLILLACVSLEDVTDKI